MWRLADLVDGFLSQLGLWGVFLHLHNVKGFDWNHKRVFRIYSELEQSLSTKHRKRLVREKPEELAVPDASISADLWIVCTSNWKMDAVND